MDILQTSIYIVTFLLGMLSIYLTAYSKAKATNKALLEDLSRLEEEKQKIAAKYRYETEEVKKQHSLDIEKRKYKYEDKKNQFIKFFSIIDEFNEKSNDLFIEQSTPLINELFSSSIDDCFDEKKCLEKFTKGMKKIFDDLNKEQRKVSTETQSIRLISSNEMDVLLNELEAAIKTSTKSAGNLIKAMVSPEFMINQSILLQLKIEASENGNTVSNCYTKVRKRMKVELNEI